MLNRVVVNNLGGSVEHYFHFVVGFCVPLVQFQLGGRRPDKGVPLAVRECGPMTPLIAELDLNLIPQPLEEFRKGSAAVAVLTGYDSIDRFDRTVFGEFSGYVAGLASQRPGRPQTGPSVVLIERGPAQPFYSSGAAEIKGAAASRRAIGNHEELKSALAQKLPGFENVMLEESPLLNDFAIFSGADVVVAQHGAALTNVIFMREGSHVIEIRPKGEHPGITKNAFEELGRTMGITFTVLEQDGLFGNVDPEVVMDTISHLLVGAGR